MPQLVELGKVRDLRRYVCRERGTRVENDSSPTGPRKRFGTRSRLEREDWAASFPVKIDPARFAQCLPGNFLASSNCCLEPKIACYESKITSYPAHRDTNWQNPECQLSLNNFVYTIPTR